MRGVRKEISSKNIYTINMNVTEGNLKISSYNGDLIDINGRLGFWTRNVKAYKKEPMAFIEVKPRLFKPTFIKTDPSEIELIIPKEYKMNLNLYLGKVQVIISNLKLNVLSIKSDKSTVHLENVYEESLNCEIGDGTLTREKFEKYEDIENLGIMETEIALDFVNDIKDFYINVDYTNKNNRTKNRQLGDGHTESRDIIISNYL